MTKTVKPEPNEPPLNSDHLLTMTTILQFLCIWVLITRATFKQRPPNNNGHKFCVSRVVVVHRFDCIYLRKNGFTCIESDKIEDGFLDGLVPSLPIVPHSQKNFGIREGLHQFTVKHGQQCFQLYRFWKPLFYLINAQLIVNNVK